VTFRIEEQVTWLKIPVKQIGGMHILEALEALIDDVLLVDVLQDVGPDHRVEVGVHEIEDQVDVSIVFGPDYVLKPYNVFVPV